MKNYVNNHEINACQETERKAKEKIKTTIFSLQVGGIRPKLVTMDHSIIMKKVSRNQPGFYQHMNRLTLDSASYSLISFFPKFFGVVSAKDIDITVGENDQVSNDPAAEWMGWKKELLVQQMDTKQYLMLSNFTSGMKRPNIMDIKLGSKRLRQNPGKVKRDSIYFFLLHGFRANFGSNIQAQSGLQGKSIFLSKYTFESLPEDNQTIMGHLALFFFDGQHIRTTVLQKIIQKLRQLILSIKCLHSWKLASTSICIYYECEGNGIVDIKLVDFERSIFTGSCQVDEVATIQGLEYLHMFLGEILSGQREAMVKRVKGMARKYLQQKFQLLPEQRRIK